MSSSHQFAHCARGLDFRPVPPPPFRWNCGGGIISRRAIRARGSALGSGAQGLAPSSAGATHAALHAAHPADVAAAAAAAAATAAAAAAATAAATATAAAAEAAAAKVSGRPAAPALFLLDRGGLRTRGVSGGGVVVCGEGGVARRSASGRRSRRMRTARRVNSGARRRSCGSSGPGRRGGTPSSAREVEKDGAHHAGATRPAERQAVRVRTSFAR